MNDIENRRVATKYLTQICIAVAILLIFYGVMWFLSAFSDIANFSVSYYLWIFFQMIVAILILFIGFKVYCVAKTIKVANLTRLWSGTRSQILAIILGCLTFLPLIFSPLSTSTVLHTQLFQPDPMHLPISFPYRLDYHWNYETGVCITIYTAFDFSHGGVQILFDIVPMGNLKLLGWAVTPYEIYASPGAHIQVLMPARATIKLGKIKNGVYVFKIVMSDAIDVFEIHKTENRFYLEALNVTKGIVAQKSEFEKRLDGFSVSFIGYPNIDSKTKEFVLSRVLEMGGMILDTESCFEGWSVDVLFYYAGDFSNLRQIIIRIARNSTQYWIRIKSNTGWFTQISQYSFAVAVRRPDDAESVAKILLEKGLRIFGQKKEQFLKWKDSVKLYGSSAPLNKTWPELREDIISSISQELGLTYSNDFWVSYC